jgi:ubiquinone/menaquinone biosynthesis C-methylase UbiE
MGAKPWPEKRPSGNISCLVDSAHLPFVDAVFDQIIIAHHIEFAAPERLELREVWRVLAPAGMLVLVVPNRTSLLTLFDATPFGTGKAYSKRQLSQMLESALLQPMEWQQALLWPFARDIKITPLKQELTRLARHMQLSFSGVHLVRAQKLDGLGFSKTSAAVSRIPVLNAQF